MSELPEVDWSTAGKLVLTPEQQAILTAPIDDDDVEVKTDGTLYLPWTVYAERFTQAFGPGAWSMVPISKPAQMDGDLCTHYVLVVRGVVVAEAVGHMRYWANNRTMSWADCAEGAKSDAVTRCGKTLGIGYELFSRRWRERIQLELIERVWNPDKRQYWFRRKDAQAWPWEAKPGYASESEYTKPSRFYDEAREHFDSIKYERDPGAEG